MRIVDKVLAVFVVLVLMAAAMAVGFHYGGKFSPVSVGLSTLADIAYDEQAEAEFNTKIGILDAQIEEKENELEESEQRNEGLLRRVNNLQESYNSTIVEVEVEQEKNQRDFEFVSADLERSIKGNSKAQDDLVELNNLFIADKNLFQSQLDEASEYITALEDANKSLIAENTLMRSINMALNEEIVIMKERINDISGARARHGPGIAAGINPTNNYNFAVVVGWTVSWS